MNKLIWGGALSIIFLFITTSLLISLRPAHTSSDDEIEFIIERGAGSKEIIMRLDDAGLIKSRHAFTFYSFLNGTIHLLKPGHYLMSPSWSSVKINRMLSDGAPDLVVVIKEGETLRDIDYKFSQLGIIKSGELINFNGKKLAPDYTFLSEAETLEGFLFPDTYEFSPFTPVDIIVKELLNNFKEKAWPALAKLDKDYYNALIVSSLLEKEAPLSNDRALIAGIIYKRIRLDIPLQIDATVVYHKCEYRFSTCDDETLSLSREDFSEDHIYNTYSRRGLPPSPIANPGLDAIKAAMHSLPSPYFYYISDPITKKTIFAVTLDEHNNNRVKYLNRK